MRRYRNTVVSPKRPDDRSAAADVTSQRRPDHACSTRFTSSDSRWKPADASLSSAPCPVLPSRRRSLRPLARLDLPTRAVGLGDSSTTSSTIHILAGSTPTRSRNRADDRLGTSCATTSFVIAASRVLANAAEREATSSCPADPRGDCGPDDRPAQTNDADHLTRLLAHDIARASGPARRLARARRGPPRRANGNTR